MCRKKKIRCEPTTEACQQCIKYKTHCHFTPITVKRKPRRPIGDARVEKLEKRLEWMEAQLKRSVKNNHFQTPTEQMSESTGYGTPSSGQSSPGASSSAQSIEGGDLASTVARFSPQLSNLEDPFKPASFVTVPDNQLSFSPWNLTPFRTQFTGRDFKALPPKHEVLDYIQKSFQGFNSIFPLFDRATFIRTFESPDIDIADPGWWACLNIVLALTHRFGGTSALDRKEDSEAWEYFQNAFAVSSQLTTPTLWSVQALLGISIAILGTPYQSPSYLMISSAIKLAQRMGLHRKQQEPGLSAIEVEQRKRVFWVAYCLDKEISMRTGQAPTQDDDDMDIELPIGDIDAPNRASSPNMLDIFHFRVRLAMLQGQIYKNLCSVKAAKQSATERLLVAKRLETMLKTWKTSVVVHFQQDFVRQEYQVPTSDPVVPGVDLQLSYFNCITAIYNLSSILPRYREIQEEDPWRDEVGGLPADVTYIGEARKVIKLLHGTPQRHFACVWAVLYTFVSAITSLLTHIIYNPTNPLARADLKLIEPLVTLLSVLNNTGKNDQVGPMYRSCLELLDKAQMAVEHFNQDGSNRNQLVRGAGSRSGGGKESVEDFLKRIESISSGYDDDFSSAYQTV